MMEKQKQSVRIRRGTAADLPRIFELIKGLAEFEKAPEKVTNSPGQMAREQDYFRFIVAEIPETGYIAGFALYYPVYYTWVGKSLYIDDIYVEPAYRGQGIGTLLLETVLDYAKREGMHRVRWQVLNWNTPAIEFYKKYGVELDDEWINCDWYPEKSRGK